MSRFNTENLRPMTIALVVTAFACLGLAACGSSSGGSSSATTSTAAKTTAEATTPTATTPTTPESTTPTTTTPTSTAPEQTKAHRRLLAAAVAKCLRSNGAQVAEPNAEGNLKIEGAASRTPQFHAAVTKCHSVIVEAFAAASKK
jgi:hypothetical protein